jgi:hypothetical protein
MATLEIESTKGLPVTVVYPAAKTTGQNVLVRFRIGKQTVLPAYGDTNLPFLVQFRRGQRVVMFSLKDLFEKSYWQRIRNAYTIFGQLDIDEDLKLGVAESERVAQWLREQSAAWNIEPDFLGWAGSVVDSRR